ncbi:MAG: PHP domain-containing protein [Anaerolineae bacterium]|nr:PHP domain-containing protein [Anaerolineae bacterium]
MAQFSIDLHAHTTASDGTHSPTGLVRRAADRNVRVLGIADHDTVGGLAEAMAAGKQAGVEIVPGVEFSLRHEYDKDFVGIHLLGYFIEPESPVLVEVMEEVKQGRVDQKLKQIEKLTSFGFVVPVDEVFARASGVPGRPHIAAVLMEHNPGRFENIQQIFDEYLGTHAKAHVGRSFALTLAEATELIKQAGGLPVFAHPGAYDADIDPIFALRQAKAEGVEGVEVYYPYQKGHRPAGNTGSWIGRIEAVARELDLLPTGGTDFHGRDHDAVDLGDMGLTGKQYTRLVEGWQCLRERGSSNFKENKKQNPYI